MRTVVVLAGRGDHLSAALDALSRGQRRRRLLRRDAQGQSDAQGAQSVVDREGSGDAQAAGCFAALPAGREGHAVGLQVDVQSLQVGVASGGVGVDGAGGALHQKRGPGVVDVDQAHPALLEEKRLGPAIFLHGVVEIQMILGEVGEKAHVEGDAAHPVEAQGVGRDLHHHVGAAGVGHLAEEGLQFETLGSGAFGVQHLAADHVLNGAHQAHLGPQAILQNVFDQVGGGGFAVGAGDADHGHLPGRVAVPVGAHLGQAQPGCRPRGRSCRPRAPFHTARRRRPAPVPWGYTCGRRCRSRRWPRRDCRAVRRGSHGRRR